MKRHAAADRLLVRVAAIAVAAAWMSISAACSSSTSQSAAQPVTGVKLKSALLPASGFPAGFKIYARYSHDSGSRMSSSPAQYDLATMLCGKFAAVLGAPGFGETAWATDEFLDRGLEQAYAQFVYQFRSPRIASTFFAGLRTTTMRCRSFTAYEFGVSNQLTQHATVAATINGHQAMQIAQTALIPATRAMSNIDYLFVLDDTDVFGCIRAGLGGALVPDQPAAATIVTRLITRVQTLR
jgi:hypothetical protein